VKGLSLGFGEEKEQMDVKVSPRHSVFALLEYFNHEKEKK
jgi:hypothetical protein